MSERPEAYSYPAVVADCYADPAAGSGAMWIANFPDLSGCWCEGASRGEAVEKMADALGTYLAWRELSGLPLPTPSSQDDLSGGDLFAGEVIVVTVRMTEFRKTTAHLLQND